MFFWQTTWQAEKAQTHGQNGQISNQDHKILCGRIKASCNQLPRRAQSPTNQGNEI